MKKSQSGIGKVRSRALGFEGLERRELLAGNVVAGLDVNGNLRINGDRLDNHVAVYRGFFGQILVAGGRSAAQPGSATLVNGQTTPQAFNTTGGIIVNMGDGNDRVLVTNLALQGNITGNLGKGNDQLALQSSAQGAVGFVLNNAGAVPYGKFGMSGTVNIAGGDDNDTLSLYDATIGSNVIFLGQNGNDLFVQSGSSHSQNVIGGGVKFEPGSGDDAVTVRRLAVGGGFTVNESDSLLGTNVALTNIRVNLDLRIIVANGNDTVILQGEDNSSNRFQARNVVILTNGGDDTVNVNRGIMSNLRVLTGSGNEGGGFFGVELVNLAIGGLLYTDTGSGLDNVYLQNIASDKLRLFTGTQSDGVIAENLIIRDAVFDMLDAGDVVGLYDSRFDLLTVRLGDANDSLTAGGLTVTTRAMFDGGLGFNTFNDAGGNSFNRLVRRNI